MKPSNRAIARASAVQVLDLLASIVRSKANSFLTRELTPKEFVQELHELAYRAQATISERRVRLISADKVAYLPVPNIDPNRIATDTALEFIKAHNLTLPAKGFWRLLQDFNSKGEQKYGSLRGLPQSHGRRTITNGVDLCIELGDGQFFWGIMDNWVFDAVVRTSNGSSKSSKPTKEQIASIFV